MCRIRLFTALLAGLSVACFGPTVRAQGFNPFAENPLPVPQRQQTPPPEQAGPAKPLLAPMNGRFPAPSAQGEYAPPPPSAAPGQFGMPYPTPPADAAPQPGTMDGAAPRQPTAWQTPAPRSPYTDGRPTPLNPPIERGVLDPATTGDGSSLPYELWRGLSAGEIEALFASLEIPPRSPAVHALWMRLITAETGSPAGDEQSEKMAALRAEALDRSGDPRAARLVLAGNSAQSSAVTKLIAARTAIETGDIEAGCQGAKSLAGETGDIPRRLKAEAFVLAGYCAAQAGNLAGAGIAAELAGEYGLSDAEGPSILNALALSTPPQVPEGRRVSLVDYRMLQLGGVNTAPGLIEQATPALLAELAASSNLDPAQRLAAAEAAAAANTLPVADLAAAYRDAARTGAASAIDASSDIETGALDASPQAAAPRRAALFAALEQEQTPQRKSRHIRAFLDSARRAGFYWQALLLVAEPARSLPIVSEIGWFAETGIEIRLAAGDPQRARQWASMAQSVGAPQSNDLAHWLVLADLIDPQLSGSPGAHLDSVEHMAMTGRFGSELLHRFATVLDALGTHIPVTLWEAASRTPQPPGGHLPDTGVLSQLQEASKNKQFGHTVLLAMKTLGPNGAEGAHMIALGDAIRALKRAGFEKEARALALEALFAAWPRAVS